MSESEYLFKHGNITVSKTLIKVGNSSYPVNGISKVSIEIGKPPIILGVISFFFILTGLGDISNGMSGFGVFLALVCLILYFSRQSSIVIGTNGGDKSILKAPWSEKFVVQFKDAIEKAVSIRG